MILGEQVKTIVHHVKKECTATNSETIVIPLSLVMTGTTASLARNHQDLVAWINKKALGKYVHLDPIVKVVWPIHVLLEKYVINMARRLLMILPTVLRGITA